jgi:hypothetical protein
MLPALGANRNSPSPIVVEKASFRARQASEMKGGLFSLIFQ